MPTTCILLIAVLAAQWPAGLAVVAEVRRRAALSESSGPPSLADAAAAEAKRRATVGKSTRAVMITGLPSIDATATDDAAAKVASTATEDFWKDKMRPVREKFVNDQLAQRAADTLVKNLLAVRADRTSPVEWFKALAEANRLSSVVLADMHAFVALFEEAARAGVKLAPYDGPPRR